MNLSQLRCVRAVAKCQFNTSQAALALHTSQPGVSTQIRSLEEELNVIIFERKGKRILGLTEAGAEVLRLAEEVLQKIESIRSIGDEFQRESSGVLTIATTHTQARYVLPDIIPGFLKKYPDVQLRIHQGNPVQISEMVIHGDADLAIATEAIGEYESLLMLPVYRWNRCVIAPVEHPLMQIKKLKLKAIAEYPVVTYDFAFTGRSAINKAFEDAGLKANVVLTALDSDVIKHYVKLGLGVGILAKMAFDPVLDKSLKCSDVSHLFEDSITSIGIRRGAYLRGFTYDFIEMFAPHLKRKLVADLLANQQPDKEASLLAMI